MTRFLKRHLPIVAAIAVLILGGAVAAMAAGSSASGSAHQRSGTRAPRGHRLLQTAASYIGVPLETLEADLRAGKSLGQVASEAGKTEAGLVTALAATANSGLEARLGELVKQPGGLRGRHQHGHGLRLAAAEYLGTTPTALRADLHAGRTLAQIANSTSGRSSTGLITALLAARQAQLSGTPITLKPGTRTATTRTARLTERITAYVNHTHLGDTSKHKAAAG